MDVRILGNFDVIEQTIDPNFSRTGYWYDYFSGDSINVQSLSLFEYVEIYDINGRLIQNIIGGGSKLSLDISNYAPGIYFLLWRYLYSSLLV